MLDLDAIEARAKVPIRCDHCDNPATYECTDDGTDHLLCGIHASDRDDAEPLMIYQTQERADRIRLVARVRELERLDILTHELWDEERRATARQTARLMESADRAAFAWADERTTLIERAREMEADAADAAVGEHAYKQEVEELRAQLLAAQSALLTEGMAADELRAVLANERGEGAGPSRWWILAGGTWFEDEAGMICERWVENQEFVWRAVRTQDRADRSAGVIRKTARDAMKAADLARSGGAT